MEGGIEVRDLLIHPVNGQGILDEIVGADTDEIHFFGEKIGHDGGRRHLDHDADGNMAADGMPFFDQLGPYFFGAFYGRPVLFKTGDHRKHDFQLTMDRSPVKGP